MCYVPQWLWNCWEGKLIQTLVNGMNRGMDNQDTIAKKKNTLMDYLLMHIRVRMADHGGHAESRVELDFSTEGGEGGGEDRERGEQV